MYIVNKWYRVAWLPLSPGVSTWFQAFHYRWCPNSFCIGFVSLYFLLTAFRFYSLLVVVVAIIFSLIGRCFVDQSYFIMVYIIFVICSLFCFSLLTVGTGGEEDACDNIVGDPFGCTSLTWDSDASGSWCQTTAAASRGLITLWWLANRLHYHLCHNTNATYIERYANVVFITRRYALIT